MNAPQEPIAPPQNATLNVREDLIAPDPLLDCLIEVARLHGLPASRASLSAGLPMDAGPLPVALAERAARRAGLAAKLQRLSLGAIDTLTLPAILILHNNQACVLLGRDGEGDHTTWRVLMPETGQGSIRHHGRASGSVHGCRAVCPPPFQV